MSTRLRMVLVALCTFAVINAGKNTGDLEMKEKIKLDALRVVNFNGQLKSGGGYKLGHHPCSYGLIIKYVLFCKKISYNTAGRLFGGITAQGVNHLLNRVPKERWRTEDIENYCAVLSINNDYFWDLNKEVELLMDKG